jgi:2-iminobutanoate/2-iminopropanoate deaminase
MKTISTSKAPKAVGPYSQAIEHDGIVYCSGQIGLDPVSGNLAEGFENQVLQALSNLEQVLLESGSSKSKILKTTSISQGHGRIISVNMNTLYEQFFEGHKPARATVEAARLPKDCLFEIECIALCGFSICEPACAGRKRSDVASCLSCRLPAGRQEPVET